MNNWIFPYETEESYDPIHSYTSDDYFGLLDDHEGIWEYRRPANELGERVDIGIGRFTVQSSAEARLQELASLRSKDLITDSEYEEKRSAVLRSV